MRVLAIGAHPDDIEIGCGGALLKHNLQGDKTYVIVVSSGEGSGVSSKLRIKEAKSAASLLGIDKIWFLNFKDRSVPWNFEHINKLEKIVKETNPNRVYVHNPDDIHQDHVKTAKSAIAACRDVNQILLYESASTNIHFRADYFIDITDVLGQKLKSVEEHKSQKDKERQKAEVLRALAEFRGYQARTKYAEAFSIFRFLEE